MHALDHRQPAPSGLFIAFLQRCAMQAAAVVRAAVVQLVRRHAARGADDDIGWDDGESE